ncbi:hypothetical protein LTR17_007140 [Elasticomyces elasticus]|nr:hypothetical protein LTR17_007140 [Elasticomyces elasticus]
MSSSERTSSAVRNLRSIFENKQQQDDQQKADTRGRSPIARLGSNSGGPSPRVRSSFKILNRTSSASSIYTTLSDRRPDDNFVHLNPLLSETTSLSSYYPYLSPVERKRASTIFAYRNPANLDIQAWREAYLTNSPVRTVFSIQYKRGCGCTTRLLVEKRAVLGPQRR